MVMSPQVLPFRHHDAKMIQKFRFDNFGIAKSLKAKLTIRNRKIIVLRPQGLSLRHFDAKIDLKIPI